MAKGGDFEEYNELEGERLDFPMKLPPNQSMLLNELRSKFEAIDHRFDTLFERIKDQGTVSEKTGLSTVVVDSNSEVICRQISEALEQWTGKRTQNFFELKHMFDLLKSFSEEKYNGNGLNLVLRRAREVLAASKTSWNFVRKSTVSGDLRDLGFCVDPPKVSFRPSRPFRRGSRLGMRGPVIRKKASQPYSSNP